MAKKYIDADAFADTLFERYCEDCDKRKGMKNGKRCMIYAVGDAPCRACRIDDMICELDESTSADVRENVRGEWINYDKKYTLATCSECKKITMFELWGTKVKFYDYCPNCGADMRRTRND